MSRLGAMHLSKNTGPKHTATIIFFHGSGSNGADMQAWVRLVSKNFTFPHIKVMYPTAPPQPYTPANGVMSNVWFDRAGITPDTPEKVESIAKIETEVKNLIKKENDAGIPTNRIIVGGFSMGGALSMYTGLKWEKNLAGIFVFSSFLNNKCAVYEELRKTPGARTPPVLSIHGDSDLLVNLTWGQDTFKQLKELGINGEFHIMEELGHSIDRKGLRLIKEFVDKHLPEI